MIFKRGIYKNDVIQIIDEDILNSMAYTLYEKTYQQVLDDNRKIRSDFTDQLLMLLDYRNDIQYNLYGFDSAELRQYHIAILCEALSNWMTPQYISDIYMVRETFKDYFKIGLLNSHQKEAYSYSGVLDKILVFLDKLKFPYEHEYKSFYRLDCNFR